MKTYLVKLKFTSPLMTPLTADTLFGHLCWAMVRMEGEQGLREMLAPFKEGRPSFVLSDGFPKGYLPRPLGAEMLTPDAEIRKKVRSVQWVALEEFNQLRQGNWPKSLSAEDRKEAGILSGIATRNAISRLSNTTLQEGGVYNLEESYPGTLDIYLKTEDEYWKDWFMELLSGVASGGFGKKKSIGKGQFSIDGIEECSFANMAGADGFVALSNFCPRTNDPVDGLYKTFVKYGKTSEEMLPANPFKRPLLMLRSGSVFRTPGAPKDYYGRLVSGLVPGKPEVVQYAYALALPIKFPVEIKESVGCL